MALTRPDSARTHTSAPATRSWWLLVLVGGLLGIVGTVWQTAERLSTQTSNGGAPVCDINAVVSCSGVYDHWQSSALGVPNSLIGLPVFAVMVSGALAALFGSRLSARYLATLWGLVLFMTVFVFWYMTQTAFVIGALCLFCTASLVNILLVGIGLTRVVDAERALGDGKVGRAVHLQVSSGADLVIWLGLAAIVAAMLFVGLAL